ncbi:MAG TPA: hypothetical protein VGE64_03630 [Xanthomonadaceae bacterium]
MIPCLLQHRLLGGGGPPPGVVVDPADWAGDYYEAADYNVSGTTTATLTFTLKSDGTYTAVVTNQFGSTTLASGNWHSAPAVGVGAGFEVRYTVSSSSGGGMVTNGTDDPVTLEPVFTSLSADRSFVLSVTRSTFGVSNGIRSVLAEIQPTGGPVAGSGTFTAEVSVEVG